MHKKIAVAALPAPRNAQEHLGMALQRIPAVYYRGGTSRAVIFHARDLPADRAAWDAIFRAVMGVPDPFGRNLDGMGGGLSSLNKICVVGPPSRADADVDYTFVQLSVNDTAVDYGGNCGNLSSAIGPFALDEGLIRADGAEASIRIHNTNTGKIIRARFPVEHGLLANEGDFAIDGVAGTAAPIALEFLDPGGAKTGRLLPTGNAVDRLEEVEASCIDAANPCVFVRASDVGKTGLESPAELDADEAWLARMAAIRKCGAKLMGLAESAAIPKVAMLSSGARGADITIRMISVGQPHRAVPITGAVCLGVACRIEGTIAHQLCAAKDGPIRIGHASGFTQVDASVKNGVAEYGAVYRTARRLFEGAVLYRST